MDDNKSTNDAKKILEIEIDKLVFELLNDIKKNNDVEKYQSTIVSLVIAYMQKSILNKLYDIENNNEVK